MLYICGRWSPKTKEFGKDRSALQLSIVNACYEIKNNSELYGMWNEIECMTGAKK